MNTAWSQSALRNCLVLEMQKMYSDALPSSGKKEMGRRTKGSRHGMEIGGHTGNGRRQWKEEVADTEH